MNIYDISAIAGVSIATVSRVLNNSPNVSERTRKKVLSIMEELGYTPNIFARGLGLNTMKTIGIMCSDTSDIYLANAINFLEHELRKSGYDSILCCTGYDMSERKRYLELLLSKRVDAIILTGSKYIDIEHDDNACIIEAAGKVPIMLLNAFFDCPNVYNIEFDDYTAVYESVKYLYSLGRKDILYFYTSNSQSGQRKLRGFQTALKDLGLPLTPSLILQSPKDIKKSEAILSEAYDNGLYFDAVLASSDLLAAGALKFAKKHSISVPEKLSIIGYDNTIISISTEPEITSINSKVETLCLQTVENLMSILEGKNIERRILIEHELIIRKTT